MRKVIYPGSFDPITLGHLDVAQRASAIFDEVVIGIAQNQSKQPLFTLEERCLQAEQATAALGKKITVLRFDGLLVEFARQQGACAIVRGLRAVSDFEFEFQLALMNRQLAPDIETIFLMPKNSYSYLSSSIVKEVCRLGGPVGKFVPEFVEQAMVARLRPQ
jgi:pantetheine-phosphate adenylyltransferase